MAPKRCSFPSHSHAGPQDRRDYRPPRRTAVNTARNCRLSMGFLRDSKKLFPLSSAKDQLRCLPLPFIPANGFRAKDKLSYAAELPFHQFHQQLIVVSGELDSSRSGRIHTDAGQLHYAGSSPVSPAYRPPPPPQT